MPQTNQYGCNVDRSDPGLQQHRGIRTMRRCRLCPRAWRHDETRKPDAVPERVPLSMPLPDYSRPVDYWDQRHKELSEARSGGDIGLSDASNEAFYQIRLGILLRLIERHLAPTDNPVALDAGCGKGFFADALVRCGYEVHAIDASPATIAFCRDRRRGRYQVADISSFVHPYLFEIVYCIDVLFHITDDLLWRKSFANLASLTASSGILVVTDLNCQQRIIRSNYIIHRGFDEYMSIATSVHLTVGDFCPYDFRGNSIGFYVFKGQA